ncbi:MAG TPA: DUF1810 domain-containing protein [Anaerolineaceae bacterium]|jgi:uncharacterized protein (DUF1810 family)|nr:DUF1810 domain-containing protein [Anaerolineaceae bacterium]
MPKSDPFNLNRFCQAQETTYESALSEIRSGRKKTHWMWFIFPQYAGLGFSSTSVFYAIKTLDEARAYLAHPVLGSRLEECCQALLALENLTVHEIFGSPDDLKLRSSMTLFAYVAPPGSVFEQVLAKYCDGKPDQLTIELLGNELSTHETGV